ncbi:hypothetical protein [Moheibacter sediminis]|uniref:Uncharacterized protein n=1 Tax=Moheibacter sediminis TaxID=1434700 RepID=A0A1W2C720_9FLAO|nr:hypothetical protein [Moheibacter sediminis]SMC81057.1 hypothetical protein SAMN06296427_10911 [Moheibacter sediminis]
MSRTIEVSDLEKLFSLLIKKLKEESVSTMEINTDLYRFIPADKWDSFEENISETGSIFDDIDNLKLIISEKNTPLTYVDFDRLATVLHTISQIRNPI